MTDRENHLRRVPGPADAPSELQAQMAALGDRRCPGAPAGPAAALADRVLVYLRPDKAGTVLPYLSTSRSGMIFSGANPEAAMAVLQEAGAGFPRLIDPAGYESYTATAHAPFRLPAGGLYQPTLAEVLDRQLALGVTAALTPTGYIPAGGTDVLRAAARQFRQLGRDDAIFVAPLDISLLDKPYFPRTRAILADLGRPVALVLGRQFDPLGQSSTIIPNLRTLAAGVQLMPVRTDFNALDLLAHGAFAGAIGTGGKLRHTVDPTERPMSYRPPKGQPPDQSPSVLVPELACWLRGSKISNLFGARPTLAPRCDCRRCDSRRLTGFLRREHQDHAIAHAVAVWSRWAADMLDQDTMRGRAEYWRNLCRDAVRAHEVISQQLGLDPSEYLEPQEPLTVWAELPAWPAVISAARR
jgi:hypothetical protein